MDNEIRKTYINEVGEIAYVQTDDEIAAQRAANIAAVKAYSTRHLINWDDWLSREYITFDEALLLSIGQNPTYPDDDSYLYEEGSQFQKNSKQAKKWRKSDVLKYGNHFVDGKNYYKTNPKDFFRLAVKSEWDGLPEPVYKFVQQAEAVSDWHLNHLSEWELGKHLNHFEIAELWATPTRGNPNVKTDFEKKISQAVIDEELKAETAIRKPGALSGFEVIPNSPTRLREIRNGWLGKSWVQFTINRDDFRAWLVSSNQWPLVDGCLLAKWFEPEPQAEVVPDAGVDSQDDNDPETKKRRDKQIIFICTTAKQLKYEDLLNIPEGGKAAIKIECLKNTALFTMDGFKRAWVEAGKRNLISMTEKEKYL